MPLSDLTQMLLRQQEQQRRYEEMALNRTSSAIQYLLTDKHNKAVNVLNALENERAGVVSDYKKAKEELKGLNITYDEIKSLPEFKQSPGLVGLIDTVKQGKQSDLKLNADDAISLETAIDKLRAANKDTLKQIAAIEGGKNMIIEARRDVDGVVREIFSKTQGGIDKDANKVMSQKEWESWMGSKRGHEVIKVLEDKYGNDFVEHELRPAIERRSAELLDFDTVLAGIQSKKNSVTLLRLEEQRKKYSGTLLSLEEQRKYAPVWSGVKDYNEMVKKSQKSSSTIYEIGDLSQDYKKFDVVKFMNETLPQKLVGALRHADDGTFWGSVIGRSPLDKFEGISDVDKAIKFLEYYADPNGSEEERSSRLSELDNMDYKGWGSYDIAKGDVVKGLVALYGRAHRFGEMSKFIAAGPSFNLKGK